jgi:hypothetical protein
LALPRNILEPTLDKLIDRLPTGALQDVLVQLKTRSTFEEQWPDTWQAGLIKGKQRVLKLEQIRGDTYTMEDILKTDKKIYDWYQTITA